MPSHAAAPLHPDSKCTLPPVYQLRPGWGRTKLDLYPLEPYLCAAANLLPALTPRPRRAGERGTARPEVLRQLLSTTERVVQQIDSVEYGLTDIQEYYANTGALKAAAESARGQDVACSIVETFGASTKPKDLD